MCIHFKPKAAIWQLLVEHSGQSTIPVQVIDSMPLPVCTYTRAPRDQCFKTVADDGHCAAKKMDYYGFKLGLRVSSVGMITHFLLLNARAHDVNHTKALVTLSSGYMTSLSANTATVDFKKVVVSRMQTTTYPAKF